MRVRRGVAAAVLGLVATATAVVAAPGARATVAGCRGVNVQPGDDLPSVVASNPSHTTFCLEAGTFWMTSSIVAKAGDAFVGAGSGPTGTILRGDKAITSWTPSGGLYKHTGDTVKLFSDQAACADGSQTCMYSDWLFDGTVALERVLAPCTTSKVTSGTFCIDYGAKTMWIRDDPSSMSLTYSYVPEAMSNLASGLIEHLSIEYFADTGNGDGAVSLGQDTVADDLTVAYNHAIGVRLTSTGPTLENSDLHDNGQKGAGSWASDGVFQDNVLRANGFIGYQTTSGVGGAKFLSGVGMTITGNVASKNVGNGLWIDADSKDVTLSGNTSTGNLIGSDGGGGAGIRIEVSCDVTVTGNTLRNNEHGGITTRDSFALTLGLTGEGNTISNNGYAGIRIGGKGNSTDPLPNCHPDGGVYPETKDVVTGNSITLATDTQSGFDLPVGVRSNGSKFVGNTYEVSGSCDGLDWLWSDGTVVEIKVGFSTWQDLYGQDATGSCS